MEIGKIKTSMAKDTLLYLPAKAIEGIVGLVTITFYTMFFVPEVYGVYSIIITSVNITTLFFLGWLTQSIFRYVNFYKTENKQKLFYSTAFNSWLIINMVILLLGIIAYIVVRNFVFAPLSNMLLVSLFMFLSYNTTQILYSILGSLRRIKLNLVMSLFSVSAKLILTCLFVYVLKASTTTAIVAILSNVIIDFLVIVTISWRLQLHKKININIFSKMIFNKFFAFGMPLMGVSLTMSLLNMSDRYVIIFSLGATEGAKQAGIYTANYSIASAIFTMILMAVMRGVYPSILKAYKKNDKQQTEELLTHAVRYYLLIAMPAAVGLGILSNKIAELFFKNQIYQTGSFVIIWVSCGMFLLGLTEYSNKAWELSSTTKIMFRNSLISAAFNLTINIIFIPIYGFMVAAISTALAYLLYFLLSFLGGRKILTWHISALTYFRLFGSNAIMAIVILLILNLNVTSVAILFLTIISGAFVYFICLYITGEIRNEVQRLFGFINKRKSLK